MIAHFNAGESAAGPPVTAGKIPFLRRGHVTPATRNEGCPSAWVIGGGWPADKVFEAGLYLRQCGPGAHAPVGMPDLE
jgi:hypothetical protein